MADLTEYEEIRLKEIFELLDIDKCGAIDEGELRTACHLFGLNPSSDEIVEAKNSSETHDNKSGALNYDEFSNLVVKLYKSNEEIQNELTLALGMIMDDLGLKEDDKISKESLKLILPVRGNDQLTEVEIDEIFNDIEKEGDKDTATRKELVDLLTMDF